MIQKYTLEYVDKTDFPETAQSALDGWCQEMGIPDGAYESITIGEHGDDSIMESWIGYKPTEIIYDALREAGFNNGETVCIHFEW